MSLTAFRDGWITITLNCDVKMITRLNPGSVLGILSSVAILVLICAPVYGQWVKVPTGGIPKRPDGKPNLSAPAPRSADGHPDLSGVWESGSARYILDIASDLKPGEVPFMPWAKALVDQRADGSHSGQDPRSNCRTHVAHRINTLPHLGRLAEN